MFNMHHLFEDYVRRNFPARAHVNRDRTLAVMIGGLAGEAGEVVEHVKKVVRDYDANFEAYPAEKRQEALLEFGDCLHYLVRNAQNFGFTLDQIIEANIRKLDKRHNRQPTLPVGKYEDQCAYPCEAIKPLSAADLARATEKGE